jgi:hypothetical protein
MYNRGMANFKDIPPGLISHKEWISLTSAIGRKRSPELQALDYALQRCEKEASSTGSDPRRRYFERGRLDEALEAWKRSCGPGQEWKRSVRNKNLAVERLTAQLTSGDSAEAWGRGENYMHPAFENARLGVMYLLGHLDAKPDIFGVLLEGGLSCAGSALSWAGGKIEDGGLGNMAASMGQDVFNSVMVPGSVIIGATNSAVLETGPAANLAAGARVREFFSSVCAKIIDLLKEKFGDIGPTAAAVKNLINICCKTFWSTLGYGLVSGGMDTVKGLVNLTDACITRIRTYIAGKGVAVSDGHPGTIVQAILMQMNLGIMQGLWQTLKGAGNLGLAFATWGIAMVVGIVTALVEMLVKVIYRIFEICKMRRVFREAEEHWNNRDSGTALHKRPFAFHHWFKESVWNVPAIAVLTLNSGICGDKMVYLSMFNSQRQVIDSTAFLKGAEYIDSLKVWGSSYVSDCGFAFSSSSEFVGKLITLKHEANQNTAEKVWSTIVKVATA